MRTRHVAANGEIPSREKQAVAFSSVLAALLLTVLKALVGLATGSLGILSEAAHSGLDLVAAVLTYFSVRVSGKPADLRHPFGHGKVEHLSAFMETGLLLATCTWIVFEAVRRLFFRHVHVEPSLWAFGVMFISITIDTFRSRALFRVARKYNSQALEADALHFSTDVYSSSVVVLGLVLVYVADQRGLPWLRNADSIAALVVAFIVIHISARLGARTVNALVDAAPAGIAERISAAIIRLPGVSDPGRIRVRESGERLFVDLTPTLESNITFEHAQSVVNLVEAKVRELYPNADVIIHASPRAPSADDVVERIRAAAHRHNFRVHDLTAYELDGRVKVNLDLEVDPNLTLESAHARATHLEKQIQRELKEVSEVNVHIEPFVPTLAVAGDARVVRSDIKQGLLDLARKAPGVLGCHSLEVHQVGESVLVSMHCTFDPSLSIGRVHDITEDLELSFRKAFPEISKVSIHAEPANPE